MPKTLQGQTAYGIVQSLKTTPEEFLKLNPTWAGKGGKNDYMGLTGNIQVGQEYNIAPVAPVVPTPGSGTYPQDLANSMNNTPPPVAPPITGTSDAERARIKKEEIDKIKAEMEGGLTAPTPYKSMEEFTKLRQEQGVVMDEEELGSIRNEANLGKQELREFKSTAGEGTSEAGRLGIVSEKERNLNFRLEGLAIREQAVVDRLNNKNAYIKTVLDLGKGDYTNALTEYNNAYNKNVKAIELYNAQLSDQEKDALTGFTTITNLLKDKNIDLKTLDPALKAQIDSLALKAGLPAGLFETFIQSHPDEDILSPMTVENASGGKDVYFFTQDKTTGEPKLVKTINLKGAGGTNNGPVINSGNLKVGEGTIAQGQSSLDASRGQAYQNEKGETITPPASDKYANSALYLQMLDAWKKDGGLEQDFFKQYPPKNYLNPNDGSVPQYIRDMLKKPTEESGDLYE